MEVIMLSDQDVQEVTFNGIQAIQLTSNNEIYYLKSDYDKKYLIDIEGNSLKYINDQNGERWIREKDGISTEIPINSDNVKFYKGNTYINTMFY